MADVVLNVGDLRDKVTFYQVNKTSDGAGGFTSTESVAFSQLVSIKPNGRAKFNGEGVQIFQEVLDVKMRLETMPETDYLVKYNNKMYRILFIEDVDNRGKVLKLRIATK